MRIIERTQYLNRLKDVIRTSDIKVITGIRRCGKSKLMESFIYYVKETQPNANVIHINFNLTEFEPLSEYHALEEYVREAYDKDADNFLFIDEIQNCKGFEKAINSLHSCSLYDIYITGSNAFLLSSDLATLFTGRTFEIKVFPFSFEEFITYYGYRDLQDAFEKYSKEGGMAGSYLYKTEEDRYKYISDVFNTLIVRDIKQKYHIKNIAMLESLGDFLMDNISNACSIRNIAAALSSGVSSTNDRTTGSYLGYLCNAYSFYRIRRYDIRGKRYLSSQDKYYLADHSFRYARLGTRNMDYGRVYENIVAIELLRRGYELYAGALYKKEIDFVAIRQNEKLYIQVSDDISNPATFEREVSSLLKINDAYPKMVIARTKHDAYKWEGIEIADLANWLFHSNDN